MNKDLRIVFSTNVPTPHRVEQFEKVSSKLGEGFLIFSQAKQAWRHYDFRPPENCKYYFVKSFSIGRITIPFLPKELQVGNIDCLVVDNTGVDTALLSLWLIYIAKRKKIPIVMTEGRLDSRWVESQSNRIVRCVFDLFLNYLRRQADLFLAESQLAIKYLKARGVEDKDIFYTPLAPESSPLAPVYELELDREIVIMCMAYFRPEKNIDTLIEAYKQVRNSNTKLLLVGDGVERERLEALANGSEDIIFTGFLLGDEKYRQLKEASIFVLPSYYDHWGLVVSEAVQIGLPILISSQCGASDLVQGNGYTFDPYDKGDLVTKLRLVINNSFDRYEMKKKSIQVSKKFTKDNEVDSTVLAIKEAIQRVNL